MTRIEPNNFSPQFVATLKHVLETASHEVSPSMSTKAKMAERIVRTAADGVTEFDQLVSVALDAGRVPAE